MKKSRFSEVQIVGILKEVEISAKVGDTMPQAWHQQCHVLQVEKPVFRDVRVPSGPDATTAAREP